jgi:hypothetical protein
MTYPSIGRAIAQAVSPWLPTVVARVRSRVSSSGICGGQSGAGAGFLRVLRFPLPIFTPPIAQQSLSPIIWGWYNRPEVAAVQGTWSHPTSIKKILVLVPDYRSEKPATNCLNSGAVPTSINTLILYYFLLKAVTTQQQYV